MTASLASVITLLAELVRRGIELRAAGDRLRYRPRDAMTPELADQVASHRGELLAILAGVDSLDDRCSTTPAATPTPRCTPRERLLLDGCPAETLAAVNAAKQAFTCVGGVQVEAVVPFKSETRDIAARLIRNAHRTEHELAVTLRDAWEERVAICMIDGDLSLRDAEAIALNELHEMSRDRHMRSGAAQCNEVRFSATKG